MNNHIAILGIHTGIGKTMTSAVIAQALGADYWKPVQAGTEEADTPLIRQLVSNPTSRIHDEAVVLSLPMSPHAAADADGVTVDFKKFTWPVTDNTLLVETAGGILSPMGSDTTMADFVSHYKLPAILVSQNYLGSINHTLLSIEVLKSRGIPLLGVVMSGNAFASSETFIEQYAHVPIISRIPMLHTLDKTSVAEAAAQIKDQLLQHISNGKY